VDENYGDDLRREMKRFRDEMGVKPARSSRSVKKEPRSRRTASAKRFRLIAIVGLGLVVVGASTYGLTRFDFVTATQGIDTTLGISANRGFVLDTADDVAPNDLVAALLPNADEESLDGVLIGTVFSENTETVAVYDGEVIWQIPVGNVLGTVLFATATESL
jgi:hypothetical protein